MRSGRSLLAHENRPQENWNLGQELELGQDQEKADFLNVTNFTPSGFQEGKIYAKNCVNLVKIYIMTNCRNF